MDLLPFFQALEAGPIGQVMKDKPATFATVEAVHLLALAVLGGAVFTCDLRLLNVLLRDVPSKVVNDAAHKWFRGSLIVLLVTGFFMLAGVATKCYSNDYYWIKMSALAIGILFAFLIRKPLLAGDHTHLKPITLKLVGLASMSVWFTVAASGRWIGYFG
jgi:hypothetical protein